jgi:hypothetical protein
LRFCVNYRKLNAIIKKNWYSISLIAETIARLSKAKWMIKIDIRHAFNRICMHLKENKDLITFWIKYETYKYLMMFFELKNNSLTFQNFMNNTLMNYLNEFVVIYLNDIILLLLLNSYSLWHRLKTIYAKEIIYKYRKKNSQRIKKFFFYVSIVFFVWKRQKIVLKSRLRRLDMFICRLFLISWTEVRLLNKSIEMLMLIEIFFN